MAAERGPGCDAFLLAGRPAGSRAENRDLSGADFMTGSRVPAETMIMGLARKSNREQAIRK